MPLPLKPRNLDKRRYWGTAGLIGVMLGFAVREFWKSDLWIVGGAVLGLLGGLFVASIRRSDEL